MTMLRFIERSLHIPTQTDAMEDSVIVGVKPLAQFDQASGDAAYSYNMIPARVSLLLLAGSPNAVTKRIAQGIVDAFKSQLWRAFTHICEEFLKGQPAFANSNATSSPSWISRVLRIQAASQHRLPFAVFAGWVRPCLSVLRRTFSTMATARNNPTAPQMRIAYYSNGAAIAEAQTTGFGLTWPANCWGVSGDEIPSKPESYERACGWHIIDPFSDVLAAGRQRLLTTCCDFNGLSYTTQ